MKAMLTTKRNSLYHMVNGMRVEGPHSGVIGNFGNICGNVDDITGDVSYISGDVSNIAGDVTGVVGDATHVVGNLDECEISHDERKMGVFIGTLTS